MRSKGICYAILVGLCGIIMCPVSMICPQPYKIHRPTDLEFDPTKIKGVPYLFNVLFWCGCIVDYHIDHLTPSYMHSSIAFPTTEQLETLKNGCTTCGNMWIYCGPWRHDRPTAETIRWYKSHSPTTEHNSIRKMTAKMFMSSLRGMHATTPADSTWLSLFSCFIPRGAMPNLCKSWSSLYFVESLIMNIQGHSRKNEPQFASKQSRISEFNLCWFVREVPPITQHTAPEQSGFKFLSVMLDLFMS